GSVAVHLGILGAVVGFSWYAARHGGEAIEPADPLLVDLNGIPGKRPGEVGKKAGVAQGTETGSNNGIARIHVKKLDVEKILKQREQAEAEGAATNASPKSMSKASSKTGAGSTSNKTTLGEFMKSKGGKAGSGKTGGIGGVSVKKGRNYGSGDNGGEGGSASEQALYAGEVQARLRSAWTEIVAAEGASVASTGSCGVTVSVDASGFVTFSGWLTRPSDPRMADMVRRACGMIGNCGKPPAGKSFKIDFTKISLSDA
ncbi:MAG: hypothetical protein RJA95_865, partial [Verrucomicrobiota bacterium]